MTEDERAKQRARISTDEAIQLAIKLSNEGKLPDPYQPSYRSEIDALRAEYLRERDGD